MKNTAYILLLVVFWSCDSSVDRAPIDPDIVAEASISSISEISVSDLGVSEYAIESNDVGKATFYQKGDVVTLEIQLQGMTPNTSKAVHIHKGSVQVPGRHWNGGKFVKACSSTSMGSSWQKPFIGDVGNVPIDGQGNGSLTIKTDLWAINSGDEKDVLDRIIIVHDFPQDFLEECDPFHNHLHDHGNPKIGGGEITLVSDVIKAGQAVIASDPMPDFLICK